MYLLNPVKLDCILKEKIEESNIISDLLQAYTVVDRGKDGNLPSLAEHSLEPCRT